MTKKIKLLISLASTISLTLATVIPTMNYTVVKDLSSEKTDINNNYVITFQQTNTFSFGDKNLDVNDDSIDETWIKKKVIEKKDQIFVIDDKNNNFNWDDNVIVSNIEKYSNELTFNVKLNNYTSYKAETSSTNETLTFTGFKEQTTAITPPTSSTNSVTIVATDTGTAGCATENIGIVGYGINQSSTTEPSYTTVTATTSLNKTINVSANGTYYVWVKDKAGNTGNKQVTVNRIDTTAPTTATIASSNVEETTFTLTAKGADGQSGIAKYEFYLNGKLEKTITTTSGTATYKVTGKTGGQSYKYKVRVYDKVGLYKESSEITVTTIKPEPKIGDFVNYSVEVDGVTYDKWRILDFDNNGHMEIVCYNGPEFTIGSDKDDNKVKSDFLSSMMDCANRTNADTIIPNVLCEHPDGSFMNWNIAYGISEGTETTGEECFGKTFNSYSQPFTDIICGRQTW